MTKHSTSPSDVNMEFSPLLSVHSFKQKAVNTYYVRLASFLPPGASNLERRRKATECRAGQSTGGKSIPLSVVMSTAWVARLKVEPSPLGGAAAGGVGGGGVWGGEELFSQIKLPFSHPLLFPSDYKCPRQPPCLTLPWDQLRPTGNSILCCPGSLKSWTSMVPWKGLKGANLMMQCVTTSLSSK